MNASRSFKHCGACNRTRTSLQFRYDYKAEDGLRDDCMDCERQARDAKRAARLQVKTPAQTEDAEIAAALRAWIVPGLDRKFPFIPW